MVGPYDLFVEIDSFLVVSKVAHKQNLEILATEERHAVELILFHCFMT